MANMVIKHKTPDEIWQSRLLEQTDLRKFSALLSSLVTHVESELNHTIELNNAMHLFPQESLIQFLLNDLADQLGFMLSRVCVFEMQGAKTQGVLKGECSKSRFDYFMNILCEESNSQAILQKYPGLKKNIDDLIKQTLRTTKQLIVRLTNDIKEIKETFFKSKIDLTLDSITVASNRYYSGERVMVLHFANPQKEIVKLLYKPRTLKIDIAFQKFFNWFNEKYGTDFYIMNILDKEQYGWCEFITHTTCTKEEEFNSYYRRLGEILGVTYLLNGLDFHHPNIIAHGIYPVIVDYEYYFSPFWKRLNSDYTDIRPIVSNNLVSNLKAIIRPDYAGMDLAAMSVKNNLFAPLKKIDWERPYTDEMAFIRTEIYGWGNQHIPTEYPKSFNLGQYLEHFTVGFKHIYEIILVNHDIIEKKLDLFKNCHSRVLIRETIDYSKLLMESFNPRLLFHSLELAAHFDNLMKDNINIDLGPVFESEKRDLYEGNIPVFSGLSDDNEIYDSRGHKMNIAVEKIGIESVKEILQQVISKEDLKLQLKMIESNFIAFWTDSA